MGEFEDRCIALSRQRLALEGQQARLLASEAQWQASRDGVLARAEAQAQDADARQATLEQFRARWLARRKAEVERLARELKRCRHLQREYEALRDEYHQRVAAIGAEQKALRDRQLALEQLQDELAGKSEDSAALERRLQRLASYWASQHVDVDRRQGEGSRELQSESGRLRGQSEHLHRWAEELQTQSSALTREQADRDQQRLTAEQQRQRVEHENWSLRQQSDVNARQLKAVQDELERVIRVLLDETADPPAALRAA
jgi:hypothetical protein